MMKDKQEQQDFESLKETILKRINSNQIFKLSQAEQWVNQDVDKKIFKSENRDYLKHKLLNMIIETQISKIQEQCQKKLKILNGKYSFNEDIYSWYLEKNKKGLSDLQIFNDLVDKLPPPAIVQDKGFNSKNKFMFYLSMIIQKYLKYIFNEQELIGHEYQLKQLLLELNESVIVAFKKKNSVLFKEIKSYIDQIQLQIDYKAQWEVNKFFENYCFMTVSPFQKYKNLREDLFQQYEQAIQQKFQIDNKVYRYIFKKQLKNTFEKAYQQINEVLMKKKVLLIKESNEIFQQFMKKLPLEQIVQLYSEQSLTFKKEYVAAFLIQNIQIKSKYDLKMLISILDQFSNLDKTLQLFLSELKYENPYKIYDKIFQRFSDYIRKLYDKFIEEMKILLNKELPLFIKYLNQLYLLSSNVEVNVSQLQVKFKPFYGCYYAYRVSILQDIKNKLDFPDVSYFFNYLDVHFESNYINPLIISQKQSSQTLKIVLENQTNYEILKHLRYEGKNDDTYLKKNQNLFNNLIEQIKIEQNYKCVPDQMHFVKISENVKSRNVIITISGFTSEAENKKDKWNSLAQIYPNSEIYSIQYKSCTGTVLLKEGMLSLLQIIGMAELSPFLLAFKFIADNPFLKAWNQADLVGLYLAHLIHNNIIFPNCSISLVGFSLGTQVIYSCLYHYKQLIQKSGVPSLIASVCLFGGVADINQIQNNNLSSCVSYKFFNCFTRKDFILRFLLKLVKFTQNPAGLKSFSEEILQMENHDFSEQIKGHIHFFENHASVMQQIDFRQEQLGSLNDKMLKSFLSLESKLLNNQILRA